MGMDLAGMDLAGMDLAGEERLSADLERAAAGVAVTPR